jgi:hypothetical protein
MGWSFPVVVSRRLLGVLPLWSERRRFGPTLFAHSRVPGENDLCAELNCLRTWSVLESEVATQRAGRDYREDVSAGVRGLFPADSGSPTLMVH